ncbi:LADA_0G07360g1_1 [Lachancea dasiensis]|uniref:LADA_0G07360g1_1 n=1 Tax=Lachancea dasiensis TaxID=1072105 RepID=A0A1G4JTL6_9SACH|nr:LADA_0G07360g1_1 [Lachancea dasiensis]
MTVASNLRSRAHTGSKSMDTDTPSELTLPPEPDPDTPQVLFMNTHDVGNRTGHVPPSYYQVATPKSPHELSLADELEEEHRGSTSHSQHCESEEAERGKYETAKREILESLNLHILLTNREHTDLNAELGRVEAQMRVLEHMHRDPKLIEHVEQHQEELYNRHREQFLRRKEWESMHGVANATTPFDVRSAGLTSTDNTQGEYFYHTRSKSTNNIHSQYQSRLRPANLNNVGKRLTGDKGLQPREPPLAESTAGGDLATTRPSLLPQPHKRNYSSSCLTSKSGVVGSNEKNEPIFKRPDGILVIIACSFCERSGFTSAQGIVNHVRLKHATSYPSQPLAVLKNQQILPENDQPPEVLSQFKELNLDPAHEYLPHVINMQTSGQVAGQKVRSNSVREISPRATTATPTEARLVTSKKSTKHLKNLYQKDDFKEIVEYVNEAQNDLDAILGQQSDLEEEGKDGNDNDDDNEDHDNGEVNDNKVKVFTSGDAMSGESKEASTDGFLKSESPIETKRSVSPTGTTNRKRFKPAEKKVRPDAIAFMKVPERDKRSTHYNLRAKSKLRGHNRYE